MMSVQRKQQEPHEGSSNADKKPWRNVVLEETLRDLWTESRWIPASVFSGGN